ncbi:hypothetical protein BDR04DRAFT_1119680 [Suillus decipiens]|nr:hypothetical protein BDR04DRAFT_1119680 [Suillus decipiens]
MSKYWAVKYWLKYNSHPDPVIGRHVELVHAREPVVLLSKLLKSKILAEIQQPPGSGHSEILAEIQQPPRSGHSLHQKYWAVNSWLKYNSHLEPVIVKYQLKYHSHLQLVIVSYQLKYNSFVWLF